MEDPVYALRASPAFAQDSICFVARQSGLYRSDNGGQDWQPAYASLHLTDPLSTMALAVSPDFASDRCVFAGVYGGILRSSDAGQSWQTASLPTPPPMVSTLVISPCFALDGTLLAGTLEDGVFRSTDRGRYWQLCNFGLLDLNIIAMAISPDFAHDETIFAGTDSGIFCSTNGGRAWREVDFPMEAAPVISLAISTGFTVDNKLYAGTEAAGLYHSTDRGQNWFSVGRDLLPMTINSIALSDADLFILADDKLLRSYDHGYSWLIKHLESTVWQGAMTLTILDEFGDGALLMVGLSSGETPILDIAEKGWQTILN